MVCAQLAQTTPEATAEERKVCSSIASQTTAYQTKSSGETVLADHADHMREPMTRRTVALFHSALIEQEFLSHLLSGRNAQSGPELTKPADTADLIHAHLDRDCGELVLAAHARLLLELLLMASHA